MRSLGHTGAAGQHHGQNQRKHEWQCCKTYSQKQPPEAAAARSSSPVIPDVSADVSCRQPQGPQGHRAQGMAKMKSSMISQRPLQHPSHYPLLRLCPLHGKDARSEKPAC
jgi:hypothetical protein